jgi:hypothetical protein
MRLLLQFSWKYYFISSISHFFKLFRAATYSVVCRAQPTAHVEDKCSSAGHVYRYVGRCSVAGWPLRIAEPDHRSHSIGVGNTGARGRVAAYTYPNSARKKRDKNCADVMEGHGRWVKLGLRCCAVHVTGSSPSGLHFPQVLRHNPK